MEETKPISLGQSSNLLVGQKVYAIGNPFGLDHTLTQGIVSGVGRELNTPGMHLDTVISQFKSMYHKVLLAASQAFVELSNCHLFFPSTP